MPDFTASPTLTIRPQGLYCNIGVTETERQTPTLLDIAVQFALPSAIGSIVASSHYIANDEITATVNYETVISLIRSVVAQQPYQLIETVAETIAVKVAHTCHVSPVHVTLNKPIYDTQGAYHAEYAISYTL
jgi:dihydroneopterin aldolase